MSAAAKRDKPNDRTQQVVAALRESGIAVCRPDPGEKKPTYRGWSTDSLEPKDFSPNDLIGILGGPLSDCNLPQHGLVPIDLDDQQAIEKADQFLPSTEMEEGRPDKPRDHRYYLVPCSTIPEWARSVARQAAPAAIKAKGHPGPFKKAFNHADTKKRLIDFIGTGGQIVCPSPGGNQRVWVRGVPGKPAIVSFIELWDAVDKLAVACGAEEKTTPAGSPLLVTDERLLKRILAYLAKCDSAVSMKNGHNDTYWPARVVCWGFDRKEEESFRILWKHFNPRCQPEWTEDELRHKCHDADTLPFDKPRGWLLDKPQEESAPAYHLTDSGNASRMIAWHGEILQHCFPWRKWSVWTGSHWQTDATAEATRCMKQTVARMFREAVAEIEAIKEEEPEEEVEE
jgi:hypothetical protein